MPAGRGEGLMQGVQFPRRHAHVYGALRDCQQLNTYRLEELAKFGTEVIVGDLVDSSATAATLRIVHIKDNL